MTRYVVKPCKDSIKKDVVLLTKPSDITMMMRMIRDPRLVELSNIFIVRYHDKDYILKCKEGFIDKIHEENYVVLNSDLYDEVSDSTEELADVSSKIMLTKYVLFIVKED